MRSLPFDFSSRWVLLAALVVVALSAAAAPKGTPFPGQPDTRFVRDMKRDADRAYDRGDYARAHRILSKGLVWRGDKYSQYLLGLMYVNGQGTRADPARGVAWLRLAAERENDQLVAAFESANQSLSAAQRGRADRLYEALVQEYGDRRVLARLIRSDRRTLRRATGSRVGNTAVLPLTILNLNGQRVPGDDFYGTIRERMNTRLGYISGYVELGEFELVDDEPPEDSAPDQTDDEAPNDE